ncbi:ROK family protein [Chitinophaga nivalis]|uniref:ROK family protein n=1 Tax=Chitinophaga nivalis TaxID=2991709 RepID=A0ABT3INW8_9BACT|nr:ROK family protein [Chitinophaga nivalis]MCW3464635.1 ROK family protein [Chitinophaga nivalis]MCW3485674.1 ROK family protein [Chitinophaga nivalis]
MRSSMALGIDIGGSHITAALVDLETRAIKEGSWNRKRINSQGSAADIIDEWAAVINEVFAATNTDSRYMGIGMPGPFDYEQGISLMKDQHKYDALYGLNVKALLAAKLGMDATHIRFINDAGCFLQGETFSGAAAGRQHVIGLTLGTGLGSAVYHGGLAKDADLWCTPFLDGMAEDYLSTRWFVKRYHEISGETVADVKALVERIAVDDRVTKIFHEFAVNLAAFLEDFVAAESPEVVVLGGNIANAAALFLPEVTAQLAAKQMQVPVVTAVLGEKAAILGAASIWHEQEAY